MPKSLTELAPLTPESASSTLSRINCEKLKLSAGELLAEPLHHLVLDLLARDRAGEQVLTVPHERDRMPEDRPGSLPPLLPSASRGR